MTRSIVIGPGALRLALAAIVVVVHYLLFNSITLYAPIDAAAVYGFFFLSGYWVYRLWRTKYTRCRNPVLTFLVSRAWRIFPVAILATLLTLPFVHVSPPQIVRALTLVTERYGYALNPPAWSLAIEAQFYLVAPLLFVALGNVRLTGILLIVGAAGWLNFALGGPYLYLACFIVLFVLGALYAQRPIYLPAGAVILSLGAITVFGIVVNVPSIRAALPDISAAQRHVAVLIGLAALPYVAATLAVPSARIDRTLGDLAYPVYLLHWPAFLIAQQISPANPVSTALILTAALSGATYWIVDRPLEAARRGFVERRIAPHI